MKRNTLSLFVAFCILIVASMFSTPAFAYYTGMDDKSIWIRNVVVDGSAALQSHNAGSEQLVSRGASFATAASSVSSTPKTVPYSVKPGDTLYEIARNFNTTVGSIAAVNQLQNPEMLHVGQQIQVQLPGQVNLSGAPDDSIEQVLSATLTAYTSGFESTGKNPSDPAYGITSSGVKAQDGRTVAVDPSVIPIGSTLYIEGIGFRTAEDTGGAIKGTRIDVYMSDLTQAVQFGVKQNVKVYVLSTPK